MSYQFDPEVAAVLPYAPLIDISDIPATRARLADLGAQIPPFTPGPHIDVQQVAATTDTGAPPVDLFVVRSTEPEPSSGRPALLWFHGGGFVLGDARESLPFLEVVAREVGAVGVSVQYRLAPEAKYPAPLEDGMTAFAWLLENSGELGIDPARIALGGQSAGAAHAAGLALRLRDEKGPQPVFQLLDIPVTDDQLKTSSVTEYADTPLWSTANARLGWRAYLSDPDRPAPHYAAPARADDLRGLPPTFVTVGQYDPLRDEGIEYARRLAHADVPTQLHLYPGTFHGSASLAADAAVSRRQAEDMLGALKRGLSVDDSRRSSEDA